MFSCPTYHLWLLSHVLNDFLLGFYLTTEASSEGETVVLARMTWGGWNETITPGGKSTFWTQRIMCVSSVVVSGWATIIHIQFCNDFDFITFFIYPANMNRSCSACLSLLVEHICASVYMIECCLTALTRKPHAKHHRGDASPAESEFLAHTEIYGIQACTCKSRMQAISPILFWKFCCFPFFCSHQFVFPLERVAAHPSLSASVPASQRSGHPKRDRVIALDRHCRTQSTGVQKHA